MRYMILLLVIIFNLSFLSCGGNKNIEVGEINNAVKIDIEPPPAQPANTKTLPAQPANTETPPAQQANTETSPAQSADTETPPAQPTDTETPPAQSADTETSPAQPTDAETPPAQPTDKDAPPAQLEDEIPWDQYDFLTDLILLKVVPDEYILGVIQDSVAESYLKRSKGNKLTYLDAKGVQGTNKNWLSIRATDNYDWFETLKLKEGKYLNQLLKYNDEDYIKNVFESELASTISRIQDYRNTINRQRKRLGDIRGLMDKEAKDQLKAKLKTIPQSIVLVGRIKAPIGSNNASLLSKLDQEMQLYSIQENRPTLVLENAVYINEDLKTIYKQEKSGKCEVVENYYQEINEVDESGDFYLYRIQRLEVYPFDVEEDNSLTTTSEGDIDDREVTRDYWIYKLNEGTNSLVDVEDSNRPFLSINKFKDAEEEYLLFLCQFSSILNEMYKKKTEEASNSYSEQIKGYKETELTIEDDIYLMENMLDSSIADSAKYIDGFTNHSHEILPNIRIKLDSLKYEYEDFYKQKASFVHKLVFESLENLGRYDNREHVYRDLSKLAFEVVESMKKNVMKLTILKEIETIENAANNMGLQYKFENAFLQPRCDGFQILSLCFDRIESRFSLNLAFRLKWNVVNPLTVTKEPDRLIDSANYKIWSYNLDDNPTSPTSTYMNLRRNPTENRRLPSISELSSVLSKINSEIRTSGRSVLAELDWPDGMTRECAIMSNEKTVINDETVYGCIVLSNNNGEIGTKHKFLNAAQLVYVFMVEDFKEEDE